MGNDADAEQDYKAVLRADPKNQEAYLYLGTLYAKREDYTNAEATFKKLDRRPIPIRSSATTMPAA